MQAPITEPGIASEYFTNGRPTTKAEQKRIDTQMKKFLETHPNHSFWKDHPEYVEKYLDEIDLSELDLNK